MPNKVIQYNKIRGDAYPPHKREYGSRLFYSIICRSVSTVVALGCIRLGIRPNTVTILSICSGCAGIFLLYRGCFLAGALLCALCKFLDCVDGEVARATDACSNIGSWLEGLNSDLQYLFALPAVSFALFRLGLISLNLLALSCVSAGLYVAVRGVYNMHKQEGEKLSPFKKLLYCQFKHSSSLRRENPAGAFLYYLRYNLLAQNGIMYPAMIVAAAAGSAALVWYVKYFTIMYLLFFIITAAGLALFQGRAKTMRSRSPPDRIHRRGKAPCGLRTV